MTGVTSIEVKESLAFISIFAPALSLLIAGGGVALYTGINSRVPALVNAAFDGVVAVATGWAGKAS